MRNGIFCLTFSHPGCILVSVSNLRDWRPKLITKEEGEALLEPHYERFRYCVLEGFAAWLKFAETLPDVRAALGSRTQACFVNDQVVQRAKDQFAGLPGVR